MTKEEAIYLLRNTAWLAPSDTLESVEEAVKMATEALEHTETHEIRTDTHCVCSDAISRQAAIDALKVAYWDKEIQSAKDDPCIVDAMTDWAIRTIKELPSAQPEIIRCTECKHYREYDSKYVENAVVVQCMADRYPISETIPDGWFCAGAERRTDE